MYRDFLLKHYASVPSCFCNYSQNRYIYAFKTGELPEWSIGADSKSVVPFGVPGVRIPHSPLEILIKKREVFSEPPSSITPKINP